MVTEAEAIEMRLGKEIYIKVPVVEEGVKAMELLRKDGYQVAATAASTIPQGLLAGDIRTDYMKSNDIPATR